MPQVGQFGGWARGKVAYCRGGGEAGRIVMSEKSETEKLIKKKGGGILRGTDRCRKFHA